MTMDDLIKAMKEAGSDGSSKMKMRSEDLQYKNIQKKLKNLKSGVKKKSKLLLEAEIALPFDPLTGESSKDGFNEHNKWRPTQSATTTALALKDAANKNENLKSIFMKRVGMSEWDTSDCTTLTQQDWEIFGRYRVPRIFSVSVTHVNIPAMGTGVYGKDFAVSVKRDKITGDVIGEKPGFLAAFQFFNDRAYEEIKDYNDKVEKGIVKDDDQAQKTVRSNIRSRIPVSDDHPGNYVRIFEIPLNTSYEIDEKVDLSGITQDRIADFEVISKYKKGIRQCVEQYITHGWKKFDKCFDFFDIEMSGPVSGDDSTQQGKAKIGIDTTYDKPSSLLTDPDSYGKDGEKTVLLREQLREYIDKDVNVEEKIRSSMRIPVYDEKVEQQIFSTLKTVIDIDHDKFISASVIEHNQEFIRIVFDDKGDMIVEEVVAGISNKPAGKLDADAAVSEGKKYDLASDAFNDIDDSDFETIDLAATE